MTSDEQFIQHLRRWQRWRRPFGAGFLLLGVAVVGLWLFRASALRAESMKVFSQMQDGVGPTTRQAGEAFVAVGFSSCMLVGFATGVALSIGMTFIFSGLGMLVQSRRDRLLLEAWEGRPTRPAQGTATGELEEEAR